MRKMPFTSDVVLMLCVVAFGIFGVLFLNRKWQIERKILTLYFAVMLVSAVEIIQAFHMHLNSACTVPHVIFSLLPGFVVLLPGFQKFVKSSRQEMM